MAWQTDPMSFFDKVGGPVGIKLCAVVVTYRPAKSTAENLAEIVREFGRVLVVDNGSTEEARSWIAAIPGVEMLALGENLGVAVALNRGAAYALESGSEWIVAFDQDSRPEPGFLNALWSAHERLPQAWVIGAHIIESALGGDYRWLRPQARWPGFFERVQCHGQDLPDVTMVITSGALTSLEGWRKLSGFDERLFIDFVDTDFCLRVRRAGRRVSVCASARLHHQMGHREQRRLFGCTFHPTHHAPIRHYYIARNRLPTLRRHGWRELHWGVFEVTVAGLWLFRVLTFEKQRWCKIKAMILGTWDGLMDQSGPCPLKRQRWFDA
jgi:rhamnosyltransferase